VESQVRANRDAEGFIFDGYPRTVAQAGKLEEILAGIDKNLTGLFSLDVPKEELVQRILKRAIDSGRLDDTEEVIQNRLKEYDNKTRPVEGFFSKKGKCHKVSGVGTMEEVFARLCEAIDNVK
jgi:adenylate kinase